MTRREDPHDRLKRDLAALKLTRLAETYQEVLDEAARKNTPFLEVLRLLIAEEVTHRSQRALQRRIQQARLPVRKTLADYDFTWPTKIPKQKVLRLFDCQFVEQRECAVLPFRDF